MASSLQRGNHQQPKPTTDPMYRATKLFLLLLCWPFLMQAQQPDTKFVCTYGEGAEPDLLCMQIQQMSFASKGDANNAVEEILRVLGLAPNFVMVPCPNIDNCAAVTLSDGFRYIVYDKDFMQGISNASNSSWTSKSILAHEIGHHLQGHTLRRSENAESRKMELEADRFSGFIMQKLGASLAEAKAAINALDHPSNDTYSSHPEKWKRLNAIEEGWREAAGMSNPSTSTPSSGSGSGGVTTTPSVDIPDLDVEHSDATSLSYHDIIKSEGFPLLGDSWDAGYNYKAAVYNSDHWYVFMREGFGDWQAYRRRDYFPKEEIKELWNKNNSIISSLDYFDGEWSLMMTSFDEKSIQQRWTKNGSFPTDQIQEAWDDDYYITEAAYGDGIWAIVYNKTTNYEPFINQIYGRYDEFPKETISEYWDEDWFITTLKYLDGQWFLVMSKYSDRDAGSYKQRWNKTTHFPMDKLIKNDNEGLELQCVTYGDGYWVTVMNKWR